tara:strand:+ start:931 stop:1110 length:180 start_codon:yes stop_codon:yes gene_type:complete
MKTRIEMKKYFVKGILKGHTVNDALTCANATDAMDWVEGVSNRDDLDWILAEVCYRGVA